MGNTRTTSARDHDDSAIIDAAVEEGSGGAPSTAGGRLQVDVATENELVRGAADPEGLTRPRKQTDIDNDQAYDSDRGPNRQ
jgi:hypothetical protein